MLFFPEWVVCGFVFCLFTPHLSVLSVFHGRNLLNLINRYVISSETKNFEKQRHCGNLLRKFLISVNHLFIVTQIATVSTLQVLLIYIYIGVSVYCPLCVLCVFVYVISNQSICKKPRHVVDLMKLDALLHKTQSKVLVWRYQGSTCVDL